MPHAEDVADVGSRITVAHGDITTMNVDAIVNAANSSLLGGGGVDGAIHRAAGPELAHACRQLGGCKPGEAKLTAAYRLTARAIIHTVGPVWLGGTRQERATLADCYRACFRIAQEHALRTLAFPAISCGRYSFPIEAAVEIALRETVGELHRNAELEHVTFVCFEPAVLTAYLRATR
jgi:O-acetyl-ADP-ribose deacetylase (regulator of RNase III)